MSIERRLSIVTLGVADLEASRAFYVDGLGWTAAEASDERIVFMPLNGILLALYQHEALAEDAGVKADRSSFRGFTLAYNTRTREEVDAVLGFAESAGATIVRPAGEVFWGGYSGYFADPDDFLWEVAHDPFVTIDGQGNLHLG